MVVVERRPGAYHDSIVLMLASRRMLDVPGIEAAMVAMASDLNLAMLRDAGLWTDSLEDVRPDDLLLAARGEDPQAAIRAAEAALAERTAPTPGGSGELENRYDFQDLGGHR